MGKVAACRVNAGPAVLSVHLQSRAILAANAAGRRLLGLADRDALIGESIDGFLPGLSWPSTGTGWMPVPNGTRSYVEWICADLPGAEGCGVLTLAPGDVAALELRAGATLASAVENLAHGKPVQDILSGFVAGLVPLLELRCARVLRQEASELRELCCLGPGCCHDDGRRRSLSLAAGALEAGPALRALREAAPVEAAMPSLQRQSAAGALLDGAAGSVAAWPLQLGRSRFVVELYGAGAGDLAEAVLAGFLRKWMPWLESALTGYVRLGDQRLGGMALQAAATPAFITDAAGTIVWLNQAFTRCYGHSEEQALGATPRLIQSGVHGPRYYRALWSALRSGRSWAGETVDRGADGANVVVQQTITPVRQDGVITHFLSIHANLTEAAELRAIRERERGIDEITGLMTRGAFLDHCRQMLASAHESRRPLALLQCVVCGPGGQPPQLDADSLVHVLGVLGQCVRECLDLRTRAGALANFEFGMLIEPPLEQAAEIEQAIAQAVSEPLPLFGDSLKLLLHSARAEYPADGRTVDELILAADRKLADLLPDPAVKLQPNT